jgi:hypothetical protein
MAHDRFHGRGEGTSVYATVGVEKSSVYVEEVGIAVITTETIPDVCDAL